MKKFSNIIQSFILVLCSRIDSIKEYRNEMKKTEDFLEIIENFSNINA